MRNPPKLSIGSHRPPEPPAPPPTAQPAPLSPQQTYKHVVYSPFAKPQNGAKALGTSWEPHAKYKVVRHGEIQQNGAKPPVSKPLKFVHRDTILYIVAHCSPASDSVSDNVGDRLTAAELALRLRTDGLTYSIRQIKLYACSGGLGHPGHNDSFAAKLLREMRHVGFAFAQMIAYDTTVTSLDSAGHKHSKGMTADNLGNLSPFRVRAKLAQVAVAPAI